MQITNLLSFALLTLASLSKADLEKKSSLKARATLPDVINVKVKNLYPEDGVYDLDRKVLYQSNLWKGQISTWKISDSSHINVKIPGVSSSGSGTQQLAGLSLDSRTGAKRVYAVAKPSDAFRFDKVHDQGPCSFHAFDLPLTETSKPAFSVDVKPVQAAFKAKYGVRPYGNVASAQDLEGNSYMIFALGAPAIAKISADGSSIEPWFFEPSNGKQRPGYTGITYIPESNSLMAFGGPRALTLFRLSDTTPTAIPVKVNGKFGSLTGTEKIKSFPSSTDATSSRLIGIKSPNIYSFSTTDDWASVSFKTYTRKGLATDSLTSAFEYQKGTSRAIYGTSAYFDEGRKGGRTTFPAYHISSDLLK